MPDPYYAIASIATDAYMNERLRACATQQALLNGGEDTQAPLIWVEQNRYVWASSPSWGEKWQYSLDLHATDDEPYFPGKDGTVITDDDILATVQTLTSGDAPPDEGS